MKDGLDIGSVVVSAPCSCGVAVPFTFAQGAANARIFCQACGTSIQLNDKNYSVKNTIRNVDESIRNFQSSIQRLNSR